ncbi:MAG: type II toxin-antitoxin system RelE/ParE family toxin [Vicinamibacterales bacterium]
MVPTFNELAEAELNDAIRYYENEQVGLGAAFLAEVRRCTAAILALPEASPVIRGQIRRRLCDKFPYALLYERRGDQIRVLAVMHLKRRPNYWVGRN